MRPIVRILPVLAIPETSVPNSKGAMIDFTRRRNTVLTGASWTANAGADTPSKIPAAIPTKIQDVTDIRFIARPSSTSLAEHRRTSSAGGVLNTHAFPSAGRPHDRRAPAAHQSVRRW